MSSWLVAWLLPSLLVVVCVLFSLFVVRCRCLLFCCFFVVCRSLSLLLVVCGVMFFVDICRLWFVWLLSLRNVCRLSSSFAAVVVWCGCLNAVCCRCLLLAVCCLCVCGCLLSFVVDRCRCLLSVA